MRRAYPRAPCRAQRQYLSEQLRNCGTLQLLQVMRQGYPHRVALREVAERFGPMLPPHLRGGSHRTLAQTLMLAHRVPRTDYALGLTQLFLKARVGLVAVAASPSRGMGRVFWPRHPERFEGPSI